MGSTANLALGSSVADAECPLRDMARDSFLLCAVRPKYSTPLHCDHLYDVVSEKDEGAEEHARSSLNFSLYQVQSMNEVWPGS